MSRFKTGIPVDVAAVKKALPGNSYIHGVHLNADASAVVVEWENDQFKTGYTFATSFPLETLLARSLPPGVTHLPGVEKPEAGGNLAKNPPAKVEAVDVPAKASKNRRSENTPG